MTWRSKVVWSEGMFLRPQHFQQHDRYLEYLVNSRCGALQSNGWGLTELRIDHDLLAQGKVSVTAAKGVMADGTPFSIPDHDAAPAPLEIPAQTTDATVALTLAMQRQGALEAAESQIEGHPVRYVTAVEEVSDNSGGSRESAEIQIGNLALTLAIVQGEPGAVTDIPVARVIERRNDGTIVLDDKFLPVCLSCRASPRLQGYLTEILGLLRHRGEALAGRVTQAGRGGVSELSHYLLLQVVNRYEPLVAHLEQRTNLHPEDFFCVGAQLSGEMAGFTRPERRPITLAPYTHDDPRVTFDSLMEELRRAFGMALVESAIQLPLDERKYGIRVATINDRELLTSAALVLAVGADIGAEALAQQFPRQVKIGSAEKIADLVNLALPGISVRQLPVAPRQIPFHAGFSYFELDKRSELWPDLLRSGAIAIHVGGDLPGIELQLWAIRD